MVGADECLLRPNWMDAMTVAAPTAAAIAPAPPAVTKTPTPKDPLYGSRWERSYAVPFDQIDRLESIVAKRVPFDRQYPNPQRIQTVYVRSSEANGPKDKFRIRTYPDSPGPPTLLEFKDTVIEDGKKIKKKVRAPITPDTPQQLLWGESGATAIGRDGRTGAELLVAERGIKVVDELNLRPVVRQQYTRSTYEDGAAGVRVTFDRDIAFTGVGELIRAGSGSRDYAIMDVKVKGKTPPWLAGLVDAETGAKNMTLLKKGKGSTAIKVLRSQMPPPAGDKPAGQ